MLGRFEGGECLGWTVDLGDGGLCAVFQGRNFRADRAVEVHVVAGDTVRRLFGIVTFAEPHGRYTRVGIRTRGFALLADGDRVSESGDGGRPKRQGLRRPRQAPARQPPVSVNLEFHFALASAEGRRAMARDRAELIRDIWELYGVGCAEPWEEILRRFLDHLPRSPLRRRFIREQFRDEMHMGYPASKGSEIRGRVIFSGRPFSAGRVPPCIIQLDQFAVASTDGEGRFVARGIPSIDDSVTLPIRIATHGVFFTRPIAVHLPRVLPTCIEVDLHISSRGGLQRESSGQSRNCLAGPREQGARGAGGDPLEELRQLVEEL